MINYIDVLLGVVASLISLALVYLHFNNRRISNVTWDELVARLEPAEMEGIALLATEYLNPNHSAIRTEPNERYSLIGRSAGIRSILRNADVLLALASHAERWNIEQSRTVAEMMRLDGLTLREAARKLRIENIFAFGRDRRFVYVQMIATAYYQMSTRLLELYELSSSGQVQALDSALWLRPY